MTNTGGPAFPTQEMPQPEKQDGTWDQDWQPLQEGMTLLDWFAGQAMQGMLSFYGNEDERANYPDLAALSYAAAEEMIAEKQRREK